MDESGKVACPSGSLHLLVHLAADHSNLLVSDVVDGVGIEIGGRELADEEGIIAPPVRKLRSSK
jgi:hypothetical protein